MSGKIFLILGIFLKNFHLCMFQFEDTEMVAPNSLCHHLFIHPFRAGHWGYYYLLDILNSLRFILVFFLLTFIYSSEVPVYLSSRHILAHIFPLTPYTLLFEGFSISAILYLRCTFHKP